MTKKELFEWAEENSRLYPELKLLCEASVDGESFINLPVQLGVYKEQYFCVNEDMYKNIESDGKKNPTVSFLRKSGNAVAVVEDYETAKTLISYCVRYLKEKRKK